MQLKKTTKKTKNRLQIRWDGNKWGGAGWDGMGLEKVGWVALKGETGGAISADLVFQSGTRCASI